jgi:hypothetical protein
MSRRSAWLLLCGCKPLGVAAAAAEQVWLADLRRLADQVDAYGAGLAASAREHQVTDQTNAAGLRRSGSESPR